MIQSKLYRNIKIICGNDILVNNNVMYLVWMYIMRWMNNGYGGKVMRCIEEMQSKDYNEKYGRRRYPREEYRDPDYNRYF